MVTVLRLAIAACVLLVGAHAADREAAAALPPYEPQRISFPRNASYVLPTGEISVVGYNDMREMLAALGARFTQLHPEFRFAWELSGTKAAPPALAAGRSAFAPMGAGFTPAQLAEYRQTQPVPPLVFRIAHASLDPRALSGPLAVFVHRTDPLTSLSLEELAAIFAEVDRTRGLRPCGVAATAALGLFFQERVLGGRAFSAEFTGFAQSAEVIAHIAATPGAIGFAAAMRATPEVKMLALAPRAGVTPVALTQESLAAGHWPLDRHLLICARQPLEPWVAEFLRFTLSRDGQALIARGTLGYLPLSEREAARERTQLP